MKRKIYLSILSIFFIHGAFSQIPTKGLAAYFPFNGNAKDNSGNGNDGTTSGITLAKDRFNNANSAYQFKGTDTSFVNIPFTNLTLSNYTYSIWVSLSSLPSSDDDMAVLFSIGTFPAEQSIYAVNNKGGKDGNGFGAVGTNTDLSTYQITENKNLQTNTWVHVVTVRTNNSLKLYINGVFQDSDSTVTKKSPIYLSKGKCLIGARTNNTMPINALIDDVRIYNRPLDSIEIMELFNEIAPTSSVHNTKNETTISPVPCRDILQIEMPENILSQNYFYQIFDLNGRIKKQDLLLNQTIKVNELNPGIYIIQLRNYQNNSIVRKKFIVE